MNQFKFQCGDSVKDKVTKATGIIGARWDAFSGNIKYLVKPVKVKDGQPADGFWIDEDALTMVKKTTEKRPVREFKYGLGDQVKDMHTDLAGTIVSRVDHQYGCHRYEVIPRQLTKEFEIGKGASLDENSIILVSAAKPVAEPVRRTGANHERSPSARPPRVG